MINTHILRVNANWAALLTILFLLALNLTADAQGGCGFGPGLGCPGTNYSNFGMNSTDEAATIEYDNFVSTVHSTAVRTSDGTFKVWGERMANNAGNLLVPTDLNSANFPALKGVVLKVAMGSADQNRSQSIVLTTDGLYAWSNEGEVLHADLTTGTTLQKVAIDGNPKGLPHGVEPTQVKMLFASSKVLALTTCGGEVWVISQNAAMAGNGLTTINAADAMTWHRVTTDDPDNGDPFLTGVVAVRGYTTGLIALKNNGTLWTWGTSTFLGDGSASVQRTRATEMELPDQGNASGVKMIGMAGTNSGSSYYVLYADGNLYALGNNAQQQLGDWTTDTRVEWVRPRYPDEENPTSPGAVMENIHWISPLEHGAPNFASINVLNKASAVYNWGYNAGLMLGRITNNGIYDPGAPAGIDNGTDEILAVETGGHTTMLIKKCEGNFGYVGHRIAGSMGNGSNANVNETEFTFSTAAVQICGAMSAPEININSPSITGGTTGSDGWICKGSSIALVLAPEGGTFEVVSGPAVWDGTTLVFTDATGDEVVVRYTVAIDGCDGESGVITTMRTFAVGDCTSELTLEKSGVFNDDNDADPGNKLAEVGETITYTFTLTNTGDWPIDNLSVSDPLFEAPNIVLPPIELDFSDAATDGELLSGESATATVAYTITQEDIDNGGVYNLATATGKDAQGQDVQTESEDPDPLDPTDPNYDEECPACTFNAFPQSIDLSIAISINIETPAIGQVVTFTLTVTNLDGALDASGVSVEDVLPDGYDFGSITNLSLAPSSSDDVERKLVWEGLEIPHNDQVVITFDVKIASGADYENLVRITESNHHDPDLDNNEAKKAARSILVTNPMIYQRVINKPPLP